MKKIFSFLFGSPFFLVTIKNKKAHTERIDKATFESYKKNSMFERKIILELDFFSLVVIFDSDSNKKFARTVEKGENYDVNV